MSSPAVVLKSKFILPTSKEYTEYVNYIDRDDAKVNVNIDRDSSNATDFSLFHSFMDYMDDEEKHGELFTDTKDTLSDNEKGNLKKVFQEGQENGSPMWQDVISFDNVWLEEQGLYNSKTHTINEKEVRNIVRETMNTMMKNEQMRNAVWTASVHYNTDNIHIHVATIEPNPTREKKSYYSQEENRFVLQYRAKRKQGTLDKMKSRVVNLIVDRSQEYNRIDELIRGTVHFKKEKGINFSTDKRTADLFEKALSLLPKDKSQWQYGYHSINPARPYIDEIVDVYLDTYHKDDMEELNEKLDEQVNISKELYGENSRHEQYKQTKLDDLKKRMGNAVLTEMRNHVRNQREIYRKQTTLNIPQKKHRYQQWKKNSGVHFALLRLNYTLRKSHHEYEKDRNIQEFDQMMDGYER